MIEIKRGTIIRELFSRPGIQAFLINIADKEEKCISYPELVGEIVPGDEVLVNTTAMSMKLGSGGYHFIMANLNSAGRTMNPRGHIMKMRYTPMQVKVLSAEEEASPYHQEILEADSLEKTPVLVATLHSMLAPLCLQLRSSNLRIAYIMTDGAALPISFSQTVHWLKKENILAGTVTIGHAFGGDLEAVNIYSGLLAARKVLEADIIIVSMGPGIVGTGTKWGFSGIEQGETINAVNILGGIPVAVPRISFADRRERHYGISHHTLTVLSRVCLLPSLVPLPMLEKEKMHYIFEQLRAENLMEKHEVCVQDSRTIIDILENTDLDIRTMGRGLKEEKEFFLSLGAAAITALRLKNNEKINRLYSL